MVEVSRDSVLRMMNEFKAGEDAFFSKYGGGPSIRYGLVDPRDETITYPPAAIAQAALDRPDVNAGSSKPDSANRVLKRADFTIVDFGDNTAATVSLKEYKHRLRGVSKTERTSIVQARIGQDIFRKALLSTHAACEVTGISEERLLRASHIRAWGQCETNQQRLDPNNGVLLSALWDAAFDAGLVTFLNDGLARFSSQLDIASQELMKKGSVAKLGVNKSRSAYLKWHRENTFKQ